MKRMVVAEEERKRRIRTNENITISSFPEEKMKYTRGNY